MRYLIAIFAVALILRLVAQNTIPSGVDWDEAAVGYNAYSILKTGRDEYGNIFPLIFRSFNDYKLPAIVYLTVPSIAIFGLNEFAVRFPSAVLGAVTVVLLYFIALNLTKSKQVGLLSALFLSASPWHLHFSRVAFEPNIALFFLVLGTTFFLYDKPASTAKQGKQEFWYMVTSAASFALSLYSYHAAKIVLPLLLLLLVWFKTERDLKYLLKILTVAFLFLALSTPLLIASIGEVGTARFSQTSIIDHPGVIEKLNSKLGQDKQQGIFFASFWHNRLTANANALFDRYIAHLSPQFLLSGEKLNFRLGIKDYGKLTLMEFIAFVLGLFSLGTVPKRIRIFLLSWFFIGIIPGALGVEYPHALRTILAIPAVTIIAALGINYCLGFTTQKSKAAFAGLATLLFAVNMMAYLHEYYVHFPLYGGFDWQAGHKQMALLVKQEKENYHKVVVSTRFYQPHIFYAFYTNLEPVVYQAYARSFSSQEGIDEIKRIGNIEFRTIDWLKDKELENTLLVATPDDVPKDVASYATVYFPDGGVAFRFIQP